MQQFIQWGGLTPEQLRAKQQQLLEEYYLNKSLNEARLQNLGAAVAVNSGGAPAGTIQFTVDTTDGTDFEMDFTTTGPIDFTINWGDGTTHVDSGLGGFYTETHTYPESNQVYSANITFSDPASVTAIQFLGND